MNTFKKRLLYSIFAVIICGVWSAAFSAPFPDPPKAGKAASHGEAIAVFAGGCFWGVEAVFEKLKGVRDVTSGYSGGEADTAFYDDVSGGKTGHAESVKIIYDPSIISYGTLLKVFFSVAHDPTQLNFQGPDKGTQYRSVVFYTDAEQKKIAGEYIRKIDTSGVYHSPVVTQIVPLKKFYPAEEYHQNFMRKHPDYPYIVYWDKPKIEALNKTFPDLVAGK